MHVHPASGVPLLCLWLPTKETSPEPPRGLLGRPDGLLLTLLCVQSLATAASGTANEYSCTQSPSSVHYQHFGKSDFSGNIRTAHHLNYVSAKKQYDQFRVARQPAGFDDAPATRSAATTPPATIPPMAPPESEEPLESEAGTGTAGGAVVAGLPKGDSGLESSRSAILASWSAGCTLGRPAIEQSFRVT